MYMAHQKIMKSGVITESFAKLLVLNPNDEMLVLTIGEYKAHPEKSFTPDLPGGLVEIADNESEKDGAIRETQEEAGIIVDPNKVYLAYSDTHFYKDENKSVSGFLYVTHLDHTPDVTLSWEHVGYEWVAIKDVLALKDFRRFHKESIQYVITNKLV